MGRGPFCGAGTVPNLNAAGGLFAVGQVFGPAAPVEGGVDQFGTRVRFGEGHEFA